MRFPLHLLSVLLAPLSLLQPLHNLLPAHHRVHQIKPSQPKFRSFEGLIMYR